MAQRAFVSRYDSISGTSNTGEMRISFCVMLLEETVATPLQVEASIVTQWTDNQAAIKSKIVTEILRIAAENNYSQMSSANVILPQYAKG